MPLSYYITFFLKKKERKDKEKERMLELRAKAIDTNKMRSDALFSERERIHGFNEEKLIEFLPLNPNVL